MLWTYTRLIPADAPTRDREIEKPVQFSILTALDSDTIPKLHDCGLPRPYANWVRLSLLLCFVNLQPASAASSWLPGLSQSWNVLSLFLTLCVVAWGSLKVSKHRPLVLFLDFDSYLSPCRCAHGSDDSCRGSKVAVQSWPGFGF